jgi:hypothetical protein
LFEQLKKNVKKLNLPEQLLVILTISCQRRGEVKKNPDPVAAAVSS